MSKNHKLKFNQHGQTLIETLVACFILVMGITAALTLGTYSLGATGNIKQQIIGAGLAREGIEVVKNMRDTNWLRGSLSVDCYNYTEKDYSAFCYKDWLKTSDGYKISGDGSVATYTLRFNGENNLPWQLYQTEKEFGLDFVSLEKEKSQVFYNNSDGLVARNGNSGFARKITITEDDFAPFDQPDIGPRLKVTSQVWWTGKNCEMTDDVNPDKSCSVTLETYLTNWRVF